MRGGVVDEDTAHPASLLKSFLQCSKACRYEWAQGDDQGAKELRRKDKGRSVDAPRNHRLNGVGRAVDQA